MSFESFNAFWYGQDVHQQVKRDAMSFESFNSQYGEVEIAYQDDKIVVHFTEEQRAELGRAEAELIMREYVDSLGEDVVVGGAFENEDGYWAAQVFDVYYNMWEQALIYPFPPIPQTNCRLPKKFL